MKVKRGEIYYWYNVIGEDIIAYDKYMNKILKERPHWNIVYLGKL